ncbi:MFS transporter [Enterococcus saigonensis]|uniref:MFS transporter n=1 Tax=Enterococcus saigonensis TaxID=1805431 RepID=A0A679I8E0_9ENTE|nr:MFS transporter [Enterococcus saigonensis]BCA84613.1 MFS transporter [Enterococcus saigonensis]
MKNYQQTIYACFMAYIVQAIVNNFAPLLFLTFQRQFHIPLTQITLLATFNFLLQLIVDFAAIFFVDKIGYRISIVAAHLFSGVGLIGLAIFPLVFSNAFLGLLAAVSLYAVGGGLLEVLVSPIVEACPTEHKEKTMSLLHSFYCWGVVGVVGLSTLFIALSGIENWPYLAGAWSVLPFCNALLFTKVPMRALIAKGERGLTAKALLNLKSFWLFLALMVCAGASEQSVSQWASTFAEKGLFVSKVVGDLAGPLLFAFMMGISRIFYGKYGHKLALQRFMMISGIVCVGAYLLIGFSKSAPLGFLGCALSGLAVGIMWPGTFSLTARTIPNGGTALFAYLALAGDLGCSIGPSVVGFVSAAADNQLRFGILGGIIFPVGLVIGIFLLKKMYRQHEGMIVRS